LTAFLTDVEGNARKTVANVLPFRQNGLEMKRPEIWFQWRERETWSDPDLIVTVLEQDSPYGVSVELQRDETGGPPFVIGVAVRRSRLRGWKSGERAHVAPRAIQRLPLARIVRAALAAAALAMEKPPVYPPRLDPDTGELIQSRSARRGVLAEEGRYDPGPERDAQAASGDYGAVARRILVPRGQPVRGKAAGFYREIARAHRELSALGLSPAKEIASRKGVSRNTVDQWLHRARALGFLEGTGRPSVPGSDGGENAE
jgi:hypothetical protein